MTFKNFTHNDKDKEFNTHIAIFSSDNLYGIPSLLPQQINFYLPPKFKLKVYRQSNKMIINDNEDICHFFTYDYHFNSVFSKCENSLSHVSRYFAVIEPNYSVYANFPMALNVFNVFRTRWVGRFWQSKGLRVIPCPAWGKPETYSFCFSGIPKNQIVAIRTPQYFQNSEHRALFINGYYAMIDAIKPRLIISKGKWDKKINPKVKIISVKQQANSKQWSDYFSE
jgi:hypothetical protein